MTSTSWNALTIDSVENWRLNHERKKKSLEMFFWELSVRKAVLISYFFFFWGGGSRHPAFFVTMFIIVVRNTSLCITIIHSLRHKEVFILKKMYRVKIFIHCISGGFVRSKIIGFFKFRILDCSVKFLLMINIKNSKL